MLSRFTFILLLYCFCSIYRGQAIDVAVQTEPILQQHGKEQYLLVNTFKGTYWQALRFCKNIQMNLLAIDSEAKNEAVGQFLKNHNAAEDYWSSGSKVIDGNTWLWMSNGEKVELSNLRSGQLDKNDCMSLKIDLNDKLYWYDDSCQSEKYFICETGINKRNYNELSDELNVFKSFKTMEHELLFENKIFYFARNFKGTFWQSQQFCESIGMKAASVLSELENQRLYKHIVDTNSEEHWWTSGTKIADKVNWFWLSTGQKINYVNWGYSEPNNRETEQCLELTLETDIGLFASSSNCQLVRPVVCEKRTKITKISKRETGQRWVATAEKTKDKPFETSKYYVETEFKGTRDEAAEFCEYVGLRLATVRSPKETEDIIRELHVAAVDGPFWISGEKIDGEWAWNSTTKFKYTNWMQGKPGVDPDSKCILIDDQGKWNDAYCNKEAAFVCKRDVLEDDDCKPQVINVYINNVVKAQEGQSYGPITMESTSPEYRHVNVNVDKCAN